MEILKFCDEGFLQITKPQKSLYPHKGCKWACHYSDINYINTHLAQTMLRW
jgi:hypothetical protein